MSRCRVDGKCGRQDRSRGGWPAGRLGVGALAFLLRRVLPHPGLIAAEVAVAAAAAPPGRKEWSKPSVADPLAQQQRRSFGSQLTRSLLRMPIAHD